MRHMHQGLSGALQEADIIDEKLSYKVDKLKRGDGLW